MQYYSLNKKAPNVDFAYAAVHGQAPDKGLYFPEFVPKLSQEFWDAFPTMSKEEIGFAVMKNFVGESIPNNELKRIVAETINFDFPLVKIDENISSLELFHGPTLAFKDVGARFMSRCLGYFNKGKKENTTVLVATSGDTGGAVANGFLGVEGVNVVILYPSGKVSPIQELQLTTCGQNITALEVNGSFDDCQAIVKQAFMDEDLNKHLTLTSANSINVARWLPQQLYYFFAVQKWFKKYNEAPIICVPSGNFGNICAGIMAQQAGLPVKHFVAACNANDEVPKYFATGNYSPQMAVATISNAMDVGDPSNFVRILEIFNADYNSITEIISSVSVDDETTKATIKEVESRTNYVLDPHGAVAYKALSDYINANGGNGFLLETAHPVKFPNVVEEVIGRQIPIPEDAKYLFEKKKESTVINADFDAVKKWLLSK
ncbi:threonine synthase [Rhizosphaericola mali]|uniref:Threonine synthase n=1 Tax=Rhizosphaericola mali TaxID=2545455 RepID=A0A5P2G362_9BACT|nr:threonine synthase [Rhizosphaericola mali]QES87543.1 threonine synthase [Rhizosphaericola mali]